MVQLSETFLMESQSLDKDHQKLVEMVNEITQMLDRDETENCKTKVVDFIKFVKSHFAREEQLLNKVGYPNVEKHQKHHNKVYNQMYLIQNPDFQLLPQNIKYYLMIYFFL